MTAILIVDDSQAVRMDLADTLEASGFRVISCATAADARIALRTQQIALALLDVQLPDGDGVDLLEQIRSEHVLRSLPVLMLATYREVGDRVGQLGVGLDDFVGKPYDRAQVLARVRQLIGAPPMRDLVLLIDNNLAFRAQLGDALAKTGFDTATASSGAEGLQVAATARPTAIVIDGSTPDMDGTSVIRRLRLEPALRTTPCLLLTATETKEAEVRAFEAGADGVVKKDDLELILARIRALLRSSSGMSLEAGTLAPKRLLTVDDDPDYLDILGGRLRKRGYDVARAISGEDAIRTVGEEHIDCILLDRSMAGMGGVETCKRLKESRATRDIPVIILTATEQRDAVIESLAAGADDFVSKASGFDVLSARVQAQLRRKQIEDEQRKVREQLLRSELEASEARAARELAETRAVMAEELARKNVELAQANRELEAFSYSVSHDLRAPLRTISAFTQALAEDLADRLDDRALDHIRRVLAASARMADLIEALLELARIHRAPLGRYRVDMTALASTIVEELTRREPDREVVCNIQRGLYVEADGRLLRVLLDNLLGNAWKFSRKRPQAHVELATEQRDGETVFYVKDDGAGFDMAQADRLFTPFHRLHTDGEFHGTGIGLATVRRIVERHGGRVWAEGIVGEGAKVSFTLPASSER
ncbi:MAG TPA: response regulator [Kofleriaceae bacterium]|nr:response regulator [Kofleriaceae bacterium]